MKICEVQLDIILGPNYTFLRHKLWVYGYISKSKNPNCYNTKQRTRTIYIHNLQASTKW